MGHVTKYDLIIRPGIVFKISIKKASDSKTSFKQGKNGRCLRTVRVLAKDDNTPTSISDIETVISWDDIESMYAYRDPENGEERYLPIDKTVIKSLYPNSNNMRVVGSYMKSTMNPMDFDGYHYFVEAQPEPKTKQPAERDIQGYNLLYKGMHETDQILLVSYVSYNREKYAYLYPQDGGLTLSNIYHSTYMRERERMTDNIEIPNVSVLFNKLTSAHMKRGSRDPEVIRDSCEEKLRQYIDDAKNGIKKPLKLVLKPQVRTDDLFSQIMEINTS